MVGRWLKGAQQWSTWQKTLAVGLLVAVLAGGTAVGASALSNRQDRAPQSKVAAEVAGTAVLSPGDETPAPEAAAPADLPSFSVSCAGKFQPNGDYHGVDGCRVSPLNGFTGQVALSCSGPKGVYQCDVTPPAVDVTAGRPVGFEVAANTTQQLRGYELTVAGTSGSLRAATKVTMRLDYLGPAQESSGFEISCDLPATHPPIPLIQAGQSHRAQCHVSSITDNGGGTAALSCVPEQPFACRLEADVVNVPAGGSAPVGLVLDIPGDGSVKGMIRADLRAGPTGGALIPAGGYGVLVAPKGDPAPPPPLPGTRLPGPVYGITCPTAPITVAVTDPATTVNCHVHGLSGYEGTVQLALGEPVPGVGVPSAVTVTLNPPTSQGFTVPVQIDPSQMQPGRYTIRLAGNDGGLSFEALPIEVEVTAAP